MIMIDAAQHTIIFVTKIKLIFHRIKVLILRLESLFTVFIEEKNDLIFVL